jgi:hypothetical protein
LGIQVIKYLHPNQIELKIFTLILNDILYGGHVRVHIFYCPISDEPTKSIGIKTDNTPKAIVWLVNIFNCLACDRQRKIIKEKIQQTSNFN